MKRVLFIQFGDFNQAFQNIKKGLGETYTCQKYSINYVEKLTEKDKVFVISLNTLDYETKIKDNLYALGMQLYSNNGCRYKQLINKIKKIRPTHVILRSPIKKAISFCIKKHIKIFPLFADSFEDRLPLKRIRYFILGKTLNRKEIPFISNHNINSCISLKKIGVKPGKIIPWDWPVRPDTKRSKPKKRIIPDTIKLIYVGNLSEQKGTGDCIRAVKNLKLEGYNANLTLIGAGDKEKLKRLCKTLNIKDHIDFKGTVEHSKIIRYMNKNDIVIVPSRKESPEGLPMTIYEAFASKTPLITSDHPMFDRLLINNVNCLKFKEKNHKMLAEKIIELKNNPALYLSLSKRSADSLKKIMHPTEWAEMIQRWLDSDYLWLKERSLKQILNTTAIK